MNCPAPQYAVRQQHPHNYGQPLPTGHHPPQPYFQQQVQPNYMHSPMPIRFPCMPQQQYSQQQYQQVPQYPQFNHPPQQPPLIMNSNPAQTQVARRPQFRPQHMPDGMTNGPQYGNGNSMNVAETVSYPPCNNDASQNQLPQYPHKQMPNMGMPLPAPAPHHQIPPVVHPYFIDQSRFMPPGNLPHQTMQHMSYPLEMMQYQMMQQHQQQQQTQFYRPPMAHQPPSRPESVMYQDPNMNYESNSYDHSMTYRSDNESHPGKESVPPKDPVNVRAHGSIATPQQHSSTTSIASIVSDIIQEKIQAKNRAFVEAQENEKNIVNEISEQSSTKVVSQPPVNMVTEELKENANDATPPDSQFCTLCEARQHPKSVYTSHCLRDEQNRASCPVLRAKVCPVCQATGDNAHDVFFCPARKDQRTAYMNSFLRSQADLENNLEQISLHDGEHVDDTASEHPIYEHEMHDQQDLEHEVSSIAESYTSSIPFRPGSAAATNSSIVGSPEPPSKQDYPTQKGKSWRPWTRTWSSPARGKWESHNCAEVKRKHKQLQ
uniref:Nanos-type domain-containing protein n=1 Tax=Steinernema glaseri TaxID=37863 RepID=A0A1I7YEU6_9BILA